MSSEVSVERGQIVLNRVPGVVGWSMAELASQRLDFGERRQEPIVLGLQHADGMDDRGEREGWTRLPRRSASASAVTAGNRMFSTFGEVGEQPRREVGERGLQPCRWPLWLACGQGCQARADARHGRMHPGVRPGDEVVAQRIQRQPSRVDADGERVLGHELEGPCSSLRSTAAVPYDCRHAPAPSTPPR